MEPEVRQQEVIPQRKTKQCWRCRTITQPTEIHHIDGNHENQNPQNLLRHCQKCHDLAQGICDKCQDQKVCYVQKLQHGNRIIPFEIYTCKSLRGTMFKNRRLRDESEHNVGGHREPEVWATLWSRL